MGGIYGEVGGASACQRRLEAMSQALAHRGPDGDGVRVQGGSGIGCRRLSIVDVEGGRQPLANEDESVWLVLNGAIYNHAALRKELIDRGHGFRTRTDGEVVVHLYEELGERCVERLRGMFALALWDENRGRLLLARDHLGQKPLFYRSTGQGLVFASEVKALLAVQERSPQIDYEALHHYLSLRFVPAPRSMVANIEKLPPGHLLVHGEGRTHLSRYWRLSLRNKLELPEADLITGLAERLEQTVGAHMMGDVPVGAFLSGGLDSSLIVAMMAKRATDPFSTFSIGVDEPEFNELPYARIVSERFGTRQFESSARTDVLGSLARIVWCLDEPSDPVAASKFLAAELASRHVKVVLGGDGGDELFAGFDRYRGVNVLEHYRRVPRIVRENLVGSLIGRLPASFGYKSLALKLRWVDQVSRFPETAERFAEAVSFFRFNHPQKHRLFTDSAWARVRDAESSRLLSEAFDECDSDDPIDRMLYTDYVMRLPEHSLMLADRVSMAHGLEVRSPLVDHELVEHVASIPTRFKIRGGRSKYIQRKLAERELPPAIARRGKRGFRLPLAAWFAGELHPFLEALFAESRLVAADVFREDVVLGLLADHRRRRQDHNVRLWMLLNLEIWWRLVIDGRGPEDVGEWIRDRLAAAKSR